MGITLQNQQLHMRITLQNQQLHMRITLQNQQLHIDITQRNPKPPQQKSSSRKRRILYLPQTPPVGIDSCVIYTYIT
jgi:hypothetical protein